jgi:NitT/TauT family transport system substrate-binding protein
VIGRPRLVGSTAALVALLCVSACSRRPAQVTLGAVQLPASGLLFIAADQGYFRAEGVEVTTRMFASGREALASMYAGEVDLAVAYLTPIALRAPEDKDLRVLTTLHWSVADTRVIGRKDRGIERGSDLRGKRVGVPAGTSAEVFLDNFLAFSNVRPQEVQRVDLVAADTGPALARGDVDAVAIWFPEGRTPVPGGAVELRSTTYTEMTALTTRARVLEAKRDALRRVLRALLRAERLALEEPATATAALQRALSEWPPELVREGWSRTNCQIGLSHVLLTSLERQVEWQHTRWSRGGRLADIRPLLAPGLLTEIDPETVTLLSE